MSVSLLKKTALLMGDLEEKSTKNKRTASKTETAAVRRMLDAKAINQSKLVKLSVKEKKTRQLINTIRKNREVATSRVSANLDRVQRFSAKVDSYSKKILANDLVRERIFKNQDTGYLALGSSAADKSDESVFTEDDFKRFEEEYNIKYTQRAKDRAEIQKYIK